MDKQGRLTRISEWKPGTRYRWKKMRYIEEESLICEKILNRGEIVFRLENGERTASLFPMQWRNRFIPEDNEEVKRKDLKIEIENKFYKKFNGKEVFLTLRNDWVFKGIFKLRTKDNKIIDLENALQIKPLPYKLSKFKGLTIVIFPNNPFKKYKKEKIVIRKSDIINLEFPTRRDV